MTVLKTRPLGWCIDWVEKQRWRHCLCEPTERLEELPPPYGELTADDEPGLLFETPSEELVIIGVEIAGDDPGLPVTDTDCPWVVLDP
jgi:hypothetical protein